MNDLAGTRKVLTLVGAGFMALPFLLLLLGIIPAAPMVGVGIVLIGALLVLLANLGVHHG